MNDYNECLMYYDDYIDVTGEELFDFCYSDSNYLLKSKKRRNNMFDDFDLGFTPEDISNEDFDLIAAEYYNENNNC